MTAPAAPTRAIFLPGILLPAAVRYQPLLAALDDPGALTKELEVYAGDSPASTFSMQTEVDGLHDVTQRYALERFHLYGHSAGGSVALAYVAQHPKRVLSLTLDEPASDFSAEDRALLDADPVRMADLPLPERMRVFTSSLLRPGVPLPPLPPVPPSPESAKRPAGLLAFDSALRRHAIAPGALERYDGRVLFTYGSLSNPRWESMASRLGRQFAHYQVERYEGLHHLHPAHQAEPERVAAALRALWSH